MNKKIDLTLVAILMVFCLIGCKKKVDLDKIISQVEIPTETCEDIVLLKSIDEYNLIWTSSHESIIDLDGKVTRTNENQKVILTVALEKDLTKTKSFEVTVIGYSDLEMIEQVIEKIDIPTITSDNLKLVREIDGVMISYESLNPNAMSNDGMINKGFADQEVELVGTFVLNDESIQKTWKIIISKYSDEEVVNNVLSKIEVPSETYENLTLPYEIDGVTLEWNSSRKAVLSNSGIITRSINDTSVSLTVTLKYGQSMISNSYIVIVKGFTTQEKLQKVCDLLVFDDTISSDLVLNSTYNYGVKATWTSSNLNVLTNEGLYTYDSSVESVSLEVLLELEGEKMTKEFTFTLLPVQEKTKEHLLVIRSKTFDSSMFKNVLVENEKLVLTDSALEGSYESQEIPTLSFSDLVGSWAAISSTTSTVELQIKAKVNGIWSDYITYSKWGLGLHNYCYPSSNSIIKLDDDVVVVLNSKKAEAIKFKVILRRNSANDDSPKLSLVAFALNNSSYEYLVNISQYHEDLIYNVPRLAQGIVPEIGGSICSPTSSTMLLKYKGMDFSSYDIYEHRYIAGIAYDYQNKIYGNWVYNTVTIGSYGFDAYVGRFYSVNELVEHLAKVGPVAISVKGTMISSEKTYTTAGHLLVAIGYKYIDNQLYIVCNDPNVPNVYCEYSESVIKQTWRGIVYIVE